MELTTITGVVTTLGIVIAAGVYLWSTLRSKADEIDDDTIRRLNNAVDSLKLENESLKNENIMLKETLKVMQSQIDQSKADIQRLTDLATNQTAINDVKAALQKFEFIIPAIQQFQQNDSHIMDGLKELRELIRKLPHSKNS